ncbi:hypothetical protein DL98DRAFT_612473 [Cadophora sp. DSE1049]|nr:hypothetical protein DL98DRAFT_612473 [Cadophora sp. DSE1049]
MEHQTFREPTASGASVPSNSLQAELGGQVQLDISRKITACVSCRKQKVKCDVQQTGNPCTRCKRRGLSCAVKKSLQMLLESDATWKDRIEGEISGLKSSIALLADRFSMPELLHSDVGLPSSAGGPASHLIPHTENTSDSWNPTPSDDRGPAAIPASFVSEVTQHQSPASRRELRTATFDIISRGILTLEQGQMMFDIYVTKHDNYIYRVLEEGSTFDSVRNSSSFLLAAICAVVSLHVVSADIPYERCYEEFIRLSSARLFSNRNSLQDIRALCIGAFWLPDVSWNLVGNAVRLATEMQLHCAYRGAIAGDRVAYVAARLYYLVYVCDHQFSIAYGRPPLTGEHEAVAAIDLFLACPFATEDDGRLISQVKLWTTSTAVFSSFGTDTRQAIHDSEFGKLLRFKLALDTWRLEWSEKLKPHATIGNYPRKGVGLHYHFAKLYLCSHAFRGVSTDSGDNGTILSAEMRETADSAVRSAISILRSINTDDEFKSFMSNLPLYFDTMIAFASIFLFRISNTYYHVLQVDATEVLKLLRQSVTILESIASTIRPSHLLARITEGLRRLLGQFQETRLNSSVDMDNHDHNMDTSDHTQLAHDQIDWTAGASLDGFSLGNYDFLSNQQFEMWPIHSNSGQHF